jgi:hypothetical protein
MKKAGEDGLAGFTGIVEFFYSTVTDLARFRG